MPQISTCEKTVEFALNLYIHVHLYIYIYIYTCIHVRVPKFVARAGEKNSYTFTIMKLK